jgi:hypothetical protein
MLQQFATFNGINLRGVTANLHLRGLWRWSG